MKLKPNYIALAVMLIAAGADAQQRPAIRQLGATTATSSEKFTTIGAVRALSNGSLLVNDIPGRRVLLFDPRLEKFIVVADSTSATANAYAGRSGGLIGFRGDSSLFIDPTSVSMLVIDPAGKIARVMAVPRAEDANMLSGALSNAMLDAQGRLVYRAGGGFRMAGGPRRIEGAVAGPGGMPLPNIPDSAAIQRVDLATRKVDTVGFIKTPKVRFDSKTDDKGNLSIQSVINPLSVVDDWTLLPDGSVAFVRGSDYHVDWVNADGTRASSAKIPFDWQRLTDEDKIAFIDSVKAARERLLASQPPGAAPNPGAGGSGGAPQMQIFMSPGGPGGGPPGGGRPGGMTPQPPVFVQPSELPDYKPAFLAGSTRVDNEGNLWIRTIPTTGIAGGPVYDVVNRKGQLVERVQIPTGRTIIGFGQGGAVFLLNREATVATLERASVR